MNRKRGYRNLEYEGVGSIYPIEPISSENLNSNSENHIYKIQKDGQLFFFKGTNKKEDELRWYNNLFAYEIAKDIKYPVLECDLAYYKKEKGILMPNYIPEGFTKIDGFTILIHYLRYLIQHNKATELLDFPVKEQEYSAEYLVELVLKMNRLDIIWDALDFHFKDYQERPIIVANIMQNFVRQYLFDFLILQSDRHVNNWEIIENGVTASMVPIHDNDLCFDFNEWIIRLHGTYQDYTTAYQEMSHFLKESDERTKQLFLDAYQTICTRNSEYYFTSIAAKTGYPVPQMIKKKLKNNFYSHINIINTNIIPELTEERRR